MRVRPGSVGPQARLPSSIRHGLGPESLESESESRPGVVLHLPMFSSRAATGGYRLVGSE